MKSLKNIFALFKTSGKEFMDDKCLNHAASLSYYTIFSIAPFFIIIIFLAGIFFGEDTVKKEIIIQMQGLLSTDGAAQIETMIDEAYNPGKSAFAAIFGIITLLFGATGMFTVLQQALNQIWRIDTANKPGGLKRMLNIRLKSFGIILITGFLLIVSLALSAGVAAFGKYISEYLPKLSYVFLRIISEIISLSMIGLVFAVIFRFLPDMKSKWKDLLIGGMVTALLFFLGKFLIGFYISHGNVASPYGVAGALIVLLVWIYYSAAIFFFGAEFTEAYANRLEAGINPKAA